MAQNTCTMYDKDAVDERTGLSRKFEIKNTQVSSPLQMENWFKN